MLVIPENKGTLKKACILGSALLRVFWIVSLYFFPLSHYLAQNTVGVDSLAVYRIGKTECYGNRITNSRIIFRELVKKQNDTLLLQKLPQIITRSEQNIFNTLLFIYDSIVPQINHTSKQIDLKIIVKERWYIWPVPLFEIQDRNLNTWWQTKDLFRINYGFAIGFDNFSGNKDKLVLIARRGYSELYGVSYQLPYLNKAQTLGFKVQYTYGRNNEITYRTENNTPLFLRNYTHYVFKNHEAKAALTYRNGLYETHQMETVYFNASISDSILKLQPLYFGNEQQSMALLKLEYRYTFDKRDNRQYPLRGWASDLWITKEGFEFSSQAPIDNLSATLSLKKHSPLIGRWYLANQLKGRYMQPDRWAFAFNRGLGYNDNLRGYEYYVMDGQSYFYSKNSLRFQLLKPRYFKPKLIRKLKQFNTIPFYMFINLHGDVGYIEDKFFASTNTLNNSWQYGYGIGIDMISYYDAVLRLEYSYNRQQQGGFYIHLTSGF